MSVIDNVAFHVLPALTIIHQDSPDRYRAIETLQTPKGSRNVVCVRLPANSVPRRRAAEEACSAGMVRAARF
ncbi:MAG TPA: hypothetical protein VG345_08210 [Bryobacteraceae bacterium]|nr:hypothetical protein [Bryobacteraceae bacterium]